jgi:CO/xanthine dehydrogenase Mo-binding subunit
VSQVAVEKVTEVAVGKRLPKIDARAKVTGEAEYGLDIHLPGQLVGKILRSPFQHARILKVNTAKARALPGVRAVITGEDIPVRYTFNFAEFEDGRTTPPEAPGGESALRGLMPPPRADKHPLARGKVRFVGDEIAAVAAVDEDTAIRALSLIEVEYDSLPAVTEIDEALKPKAPLVHDEIKDNLAAHLHGTWGDFDGALKESDHVFEDTFSTQHQHQACMETHGCICKWDSEGNLTMWAGVQTPHTIRLELSKVLDMPESKIRLISKYVGGAFGSKNELEPFMIICSQLAKASRAPVSLILSREEEFMATGCRHPYRVTVRTGLKKTGEIMAREVKILVDKGAYMCQGAAVAFFAICYPSASLYKPKAVRFDAKIIYTNKQPPSAYRGFGNPQASFAIESQMDMIAERLGLDPVKFRLLNANRPGDITAHGFKMPQSTALTECIERAVDAIGWYEKKQHPIPNRGLGLACLIHSTGERGAYGNIEGSSCTLKVNDDGSVTIFAGTQDLGTGAWTVLAQICADSLGVKFEEIRVVAGDTDLPAFDLGAYASRSTFTGGNAVRIAASKMKEDIFSLASELLHLPASDLDIGSSVVFSKSRPEAKVTLREVAKYAYYGAGKPKNLITVGVYDTPSTLIDPRTGMWKEPGPSIAYTFACHAAEVEVNPETGRVKVINLVAAHDVGKVINPTTAEGQIEGAALHGLGLALWEDMRIEKGVTLVKDFRDYFILRAPDMPPVKVIFVEKSDPNGPFGAKGIAEAALVPVAPAIANAVADAIKARVTSLPLTPEKVLNTLK